MGCSQISVEVQCPLRLTQGGQLHQIVHNLFRLRGGVPYVSYNHVKVTEGLVRISICSQRSTRMLPLFVPSVVAHSFSPVGFHTLPWPLSQLDALSLVVIVLLIFPGCCRPIFCAAILCSMQSK